MPDESEAVRRAREIVRMVRAYSRRVDAFADDADIEDITAVETPAALAADRNPKRSGTYARSDATVEVAQLKRSCFK